MNTLKGYIACFFLLLLISSQSVAQQWSECPGDSVLPKKDWVTGISSRLQESMLLTLTDNVHTDFHGIWMHSEWKDKFGPCGTGDRWTTVPFFQQVIDSGKIPVIFWWWHHDQPSSTYLRQEAEQQLRDCLIPFLNDINRPGKEVWIVLQPEYNMQNVHLDPTFATHLITMIDALHAGVTGVKIKVGPSPGNFGNYEDRYRLQPSLKGVMEKSDFIAFHDIQRNQATQDAIWSYPVPNQLKTCFSFCQFLQKEFHKPILFGYWAVSNQTFSEAKQAEALEQIFKNRATFEAYGVFGFGAFWYKSENDFPAEGLKSTSGTPFKVQQVYKDNVNSIASGTDGFHSMAFLDLEYGNKIDFPLTVRWISRGKTGSINYKLYYQALPDTNLVLISDQLQGESHVINQLIWDPCNLPSMPEMYLVLKSDDGVVSKSPKIYYNNLKSVSDATINMEDGDLSKFIAVTSGITFNVGSVATSGTKSLTVNLANKGVDWNYFQIKGPIAYTGESILEMMVYVPYSLNPTLEMGSEVTKASFYAQTTVTWSTMESKPFSLNQGWNRVVWDYNLNGSDPKEFDHIEFRLWNRMWAYNETAKIYIDDIKLGGVNSYSKSNDNCTTQVTPLPSCKETGGFTTNVDIATTAQVELKDYCFPNPFNDGVTIKNGGLKNIIITDLYGKTIYTSPNQISSFDTKAWAQGIYFLSGTSEGIAYRQKIIKQ